MMKKIIMLFTAFICLFFVDPTVAFAADEDVILNDASGIPDKNLYQAILQEMAGMPDLFQESRDRFTKEEAGRITSLWVPNGGVSDLTGIGCLGNLKTLSIRDNWNQKQNEIISLKPLQGLKNLETLDIDHNSIAFANLEEISVLTQLKKLSVTRSGLMSLKGIENLIGLEYLELQSNSLTRLDGIENLTQLKTLRASENRLANVGNLAKLSNLEILNLGNNLVKGIKGVEYLHNLKSLTLDSNQLESIDEIKKLKNLDFLSVQNNKLKKIPNLKNLNIKGDSCGLDFRGNDLSEKELKNKLKKHLGKKKFHSKWFRDQVVFQNNYELKLAKPKSVKGITKKTVKITGKIKRNGPYKKEIYVSINDKSGRTDNRRAKVNKQGKLLRSQGGRKNSLVSVDRAGNFVIEGKKLKSTLKKGGELYLDIYLYSEERGKMSEVQSIPLTLQ